MKKIIILSIVFLFVSLCFQPAYAIQLKKEIEPIRDSPKIDFLVEILGDKWVAILVTAWNDTSGLDRLEIYFNGMLKEVFYGNVINERIFDFRYPPVPFLIIKAVAYDKAGNRAEKSINLREMFDFNIHSGNKNSNLELYDVEDCDCQEIDSKNDTICGVLLIKYFIRVEIGIFFLVCSYTVPSGRILYSIFWNIWELFDS